MSTQMDDMSPAQQAAMTRSVRSLKFCLVDMAAQCGRVFYAMEEVMDSMGFSEEGEGAPFFQQANESFDNLNDHLLWQKDADYARKVEEALARTEACQEARTGILYPTSSGMERGQLLSFAKTKKPNKVWKDKEAEQGLEEQSMDADQPSSDEAAQLCKDKEAERGLEELSPLEEEEAEEEKKDGLEEEHEVLQEDEEDVTVEAEPDQEHDEEEMAAGNELGQEDDEEEVTVEDEKPTHKDQPKNRQLFGPGLTPAFIPRKGKGHGKGKRNKGGKRHGGKGHGGKGGKGKHGKEYEDPEAKNQRLINKQKAVRAAVEASKKQKLEGVACSKAACVARMTDEDDLFFCLEKESASPTAPPNPPRPRPFRLPDPHTTHMFRLTNFNASKITYRTHSGLLTLFSRTTTFQGPASCSLAVRASCCLAVRASCPLAIRASCSSPLGLHVPSRLGLHVASPLGLRVPSPVGRHLYA